MAFPSHRYTAIIRYWSESEQERIIENFGIYATDHDDAWRQAEEECKRVVYEGAYPFVYAVFQGGPIAPSSSWAGETN